METIQMPAFERRFQKAESRREQYGRVVLVTGPPGSGKTTLGLSTALEAPPVLLCNLDNRAEDALAVAIETYGEENIRRSDYVMPLNKTDALAREAAWDKFSGDMQSVLSSNGTHGTVIWDTGSEVWQLLSAHYLEKVLEDRKAKKGESAELYPFDYAIANRKYKELVDKIKSAGWNLVITAREKEIWRNGQSTGTYEPEVNKHTAYLADVCLEMKKTSKGGIVQRKALFTKHGVHDSYEGTYIANPDWSAIIATLVG